MARPNSEERERIASRRAKIERLLEEDVRNSRLIAELLEMDQADESQLRLIRKDVACIERAWAREDRTTKRGLRRARQIARLRRLRAEALEAWERSKSERQATRARRRSRSQGEGSTVDDETELRKEQRDGDPRFLKAIIEIEAQLAELEGTRRPRLVRQRQTVDGRVALFDPAKLSETALGALSVEELAALHRETLGLPGESSP